MQNGVRLSVVVPAFNEAHRLPATLTRVVSFLAGSDHWLPAEVIVVDDGSTDGTVAVAENHPGAPGVQVRLWEQGEESGKGSGGAGRVGRKPGRLGADLRCGPGGADRGRRPAAGR